MSRGFARRGSRKRQRQMAVLAVLSVLGTVFLIWLFTQIPWDGVSVFVFSIMLTVVLGAAVAEIVRRVKIELKKSERLEKAEETSSTSQMNHMTPTEFEHYVATLFEGLGYSAIVTKQSGDGGIDIILNSGDGKASVQVKRYAESFVGRPDIQKLVGASIKDFKKMYFVTSSDFTAEARAYAQDHGVLLVNGEELLSMSKRVFGPESRQKTFSFAFQHRLTK
jgi:hypothetical protein